MGARAFLRAYSGFSPTPKSGQLAQPLPGQLLHLPPPREHHPPRIRSAVCSQELCRLFAGAAGPLAAAGARGGAEGPDRMAPLCMIEAFEGPPPSPRRLRP